MPLFLAECDQDFNITRITGSDKIKKHLNNIGFIVGQPVTVVTRVDDNLIVKIKGISIALSHDLAKRIYV